MNRKGIFVSVAAVFLAVGRIASAGGLELLPGGTRSVSRGGAVAARPEDPMVLAHNPAGLAWLSGNQIMLDVDVPLHSMCVDPYGYYGWGVYDDATSEFGDPLEMDDPNDPTIGATYATTPMPKVCNSAPATPLPQLAWAGKVTDELGIGAGFVAPTVVPGLHYGGDDGTIDTAYGPRPTPTRYTLVNQKVKFALAPAIGAAYRIIPQLSAGLTLQVGMIHAKSRVVQAWVAGTNPAGDWLVDIDAKDYFIPALTFSVHAKPIPALNLMASFRWVDDFDGSGSVVTETNTFHRGATSGPVPFENLPIDLEYVTVRPPWQLSAGVRYAGLLTRADSGSSPGPGDPMDTELWDVEFDVNYAINARVRSSAFPAEDVSLTTRNADGTGAPAMVAREDLSPFDTGQLQVNSVAFRLGGSLSVLPRQLALHAGGFFETRGSQPEHADIGTFAFQRVGLGLGFVVRLGPFDLRAGYGHIFSETLEVVPPPHEPVEDARRGDDLSGFDQRVGGTFGDDGVRSGGVVLRDPDAPSPESADAVAQGKQDAAVSTPARPERIVNAGKYTASFNELSFGAVYHF